MRMLPPDQSVETRVQAFCVFDDFFEFTTGDLFASILTDTGTAAVEDAAGGVILLTPSDGTVADNDEAYIKGKQENFLIADDKPIYFGIRAKFTEANTDDANVAFGMMNAVAANSILDNGGGPAASYSGFCFFKVDGGLVWNFESSIAGVQVTTALSDVANAGDGVYRTFEVEVRPRSTTRVEFIPKINGKQCLDANYQPVKHEMTFTGATEMQLFAGVKNGDTNLETLRVDWICGRQLR